MKRLVSLVVVILAVSLGLGLTAHHLQRVEGVVGSGNNVLNLYNWGDYIDPALITKFEHETGYHVSYQTFDSNESMYTKIKQGGTSYDLTVPSEYMVQRMKADHLLRPLDKSRLTGMNNISPQFKNLAFDPHNEYSVPYFWGTLGIVYNDKFVKKGELTTWDDLWKPQFKDNIMLVDSSRDILGLALMSQGHSANTHDQAQLDEAEQKLTKLTPNVKAVLDDEIMMYMEQNESAVAVTYSGNAAEMISNNSHLHYVIPKPSTNLWIDNLVIPKTAKHLKAAYAFINFMNRPENAKQNAEYVGYSTPNAPAEQLLPADVRQDKEFYPSASVIKDTQVYQDLGVKETGTYNDLFLQFKMFRK
ncbi:MAG: ABC transporter substrate-binding protein [Furfurilactobacillus sp.]|jgi:spermidine/putrescine transport system substrate-binding protein|uniref:ABC transporter substrate-binding protein n=2 Tax=Furfurilactobacillus TaxID=2767882 RepID=A0ABT6D949_9LACO|nr:MULTISPECIES: ABC transporter substrate-binding protein [Furfurilactobacillus]QLE67246.1 ABC transporter periplasmic spermidine putrescine-binding protein PotD [Furfurilactobacillus rossiae]MCF6161063.1 ABC transporter substrate-binding protein [Furfurilactobacillus milii]MCF6163447.1 ABC transporter substrate-binding protein [Furfurilactobacillus milii]MCF6418751.1 ABC transporter substrate-binding protein [Furfurilactobacillus milii]MCH4011437.1 ABC transporter substrate-binding protein [